MKDGKDTTSSQETTATAPRTGPREVLRASAICKTYPGKPCVRALTGVDLCVSRGERVAILGPSGAGKSTLLNILGLLDTPTSGSLAVDGSDTAALSERQRNRFRARNFGFVFQENHVLGQRTVAENIEVALAIGGVPRRERTQHTLEALKQVGLDARAGSLARLLSGGEKQRLSIARAFVNRPAIVLADEPTGNLDGGNARTVLDLFDRQAANDAAVVVITHDTRLADWADRSLLLTDGELVPACQPDTTR